MKSEIINEESTRLTIKHETKTFVILPKGGPEGTWIIQLTDHAIAKNSITKAIEVKNISMFLSAAEVTSILSFLNEINQNETLY